MRARPSVAAPGRGSELAAAGPWRERATPEQALALALCGTTRRRRDLEGLARRALAAADLDRVADHLDRQRLLPLIGTRLLELEPGLPEALHERVSMSVDATAGTQMLHMMVLMRIQGALEQAGIAALPIKGPPLARMLYGNAGMRPSGDLDVVVPPARLFDAVRVLETLGYRPPHDPRDRQGLPLLHLVLGHATLPVLELHWRVHWYETRFTGDMLDRSVVGPEGRRAQPLDELVTLLLIYARDGFAGLRMAADIAAWWDLHADAIDPDGVHETCSRYPQLAAALGAACRAAHRLTGAPAVDARLPAGGAAARRAVPRLVNWALTGTVNQIDANVSLVDGFLTPRGGRLAFVRRTLVPRRAVVVWRDPLLAERGRVALVLAHLQVAPRVLRRFAIALWKVRGGRSWPPPLPRP